MQVERGAIRKWDGKVVILPIGSTTSMGKSYWCKQCATSMPMPMDRDRKEAAGLQ